MPKQRKDHHRLVTHSRQTQSTRSADRISGNGRNTLVRSAIGPFVAALLLLSLFASSSEAARLPKPQVANKSHHVGARRGGVSRLGSTSLGKRSGLIRRGSVRRGPATSRRTFGQSVVRNLPTGRGTIKLDLGRRLPVNGNRRLIPISSDLSTPDFTNATALKVVGVIDPQTLLARKNGENVQVRLLGVDPATSETANEAFQYAATGYLRDKLLNKEIYLALDPDLAETGEAGNLPAYVYRAADGLLVNLDMIEKGYGLAAEGYEFRYASQFQRSQQRAETDGRGLWGLVQD